jgi:hypothetical protein
MWGNWYWRIYLALFTTAFLGPEIYALSSNASNTLSDFVWRTLKPNSAVWYLSLGLWVTLTSWLVFHFWFRRYR